MKRIVKGVAYNTATAALLGKKKWVERDHNDNEASRGIDILYATKGGAFFVHEHLIERRWNEAERRYYEDPTDRFVPMSPEAAHRWLMADDVDVEVFNNPFDEPPEASAKAEPGSTIYFRVPAALKTRIEKAAAEASTSVNTWMMRCAEQCLPKPKKGRKNR
jgi:hypothetical protein